MVKIKDSRPVNVFGVHVRLECVVGVDKTIFPPDSSVNMRDSSIVRVLRVTVE